MTLQNTSATAPPAVKICGVTSVRDVELVDGSGVEYVGFNFFPPSPRAVTPEWAKTLRGGLREEVKAVGVFVNEPADVVQRIVDEVGLDLVQFHGDESMAVMEPFADRAIRALRVTPGLDLDAELERLDAFWGVLFDAPAEGLYGGSGETWAYRLVAGACAGRRVFLAGGLRPENIAAAVADLPDLFAVDVCSGVEERPGVKDPDRVRRFLAALDRAHGGAEPLPIPTDRTDIGGSP